MSKSGKRASGAEPDEHQSGFVLDILYQDARRVGSFLSQFDDAGLLQKVIERESSTKGKKRGFKFNVGGGASILGTGGSGTFGIERGPGEQGAEASERVYDPFWTNTLTLLDFLTAADLIQPDLRSAQIGQFVKVSGTLRIHDLMTVKRLWDLPSVQRQSGLAPAPSGNRKERKRREATGHSGDTSAIEMGFEIFAPTSHIS